MRIITCNRRLILAGCALVALFGALPRLSAAQELDIPTLEAVVLADDRAHALAGLVPDSDAQRFLTGLGLQATGDLPAVDRLIAAWRAQENGGGQLLERLAARQDVLWYDRDPAEGRKRLITRFSLAFDDTIPGAARAALSDHLDPAFLAWATLREPFARGSEVAGQFTQAGVRRLLGEVHEPERRHQLLLLLEQADTAPLAAAVLADLTERKGARFADLPCHRALTLAQLGELAVARPALRGSETFVAAWVAAERAAFATRRLRWDTALQRAWATRLAELSAPLPHHLGRLHQQALRAQLEAERALGVYDRAHLLAYLAVRPDESPVPRTAAHGEGELPAEDVLRAAGIVPVSDADLLDDLLLQLLRTREDVKAVAPSIAEEWLERRYAEDRLLRGEPPEPGAAALPASALEELRDRVDLAFAPANRAFYDGDDAVALDLDIKHVERLLVRIYRLDAAALLRGGHEAGADLELAGLVPSAEREVVYAQAPLLRHREHLALPELAAPGQYVVDVVAGGRSLRTLITKGELVAVPSYDRDGQWLTLLDERGRTVADAQVRIKEQDFIAAADGRVRLPYGSGERVSALLRGAGRASRASVQMAREDYALRGQVLCARSQFVAGAEAALPIHVELLLGGRALPLATIEDARVELTWTCADKIERHDVRRNLRLADDADLVVRFAVPEELRDLRVALLGSVRRRSDGGMVPVSLEGRIALGAANDSDRLGNLHLLHDQDGWTALLLGRGGEPLADESALLELHSDLRQDALPVTLRSGAGGRIPLGQLAEVGAVGEGGLGAGRIGESWELIPAPPLPAAIAVRAAAPFSIVVGAFAMDPADPPWRLYQVAGAVRATDLSARLAYADGVLSCAGLGADDYLLTVRDRTGRARLVPVTVADGPTVGAVVVERERSVPIGGGEALAIGVPVEQGQALVVPLGGAGAGARVHVFAAVLAGDRIAGACPGAEPQEDAPRPASITAVRQLDDEERYVLERRRLVPAPGVMAERPGLVLNPADDSAVERNDAFASRSGGGKRRALSAGGGARMPSLMAPEPQHATASWDVLAHPGALLANLRADAQGRVTIPRAALGDASLLTVVACAGARITVRQLTLPAHAPELRDRRLAMALDPALGLAYVPTLRVLRAGERVALGGAFERYQMIDTIDTAWRWLAAQDGADLGEWSFLGTWPGLSDARKRELYRRFAGHELHCFLARHDPAFFTQAIAPYLRNKAQPELVDRWLLGVDLAGDAVPWRLEQCNAAERAMLAQALAGPGHQALGGGQARWLADAVARDPAPAERFARAVGAALDLAAQSAAAQSTGSRMLPPAPAPEEGAKFEKEADAAAPPAMTPAPVAATSRAKSAGNAFMLAVEPAPELYVEPGATRMLVESAYHGVPRSERNPGLVPPARLWAEFAAAPAGAPFLSTAMGELGPDATERLLALALSDLPFTAGVHQVVRDGQTTTLIAGSPAILARAALEALPNAASDVLLRVELTNAAEDVQASERAPLLVADLAPRTAYVQRITLVNTGSSPRTLAVLAQIPQGAVALRATPATRMDLLELAPAATITLRSVFYFPQSGTYPQHPVVASDGHAVLARGGGGQLHVVPAAGDWRTSGDLGRVLAGLGSADLSGLDLAPLLGLLRDATAYRRITAALAARGLGTWVGQKYAFLHDDAAGIAAFLRNEPELMDQLGTVLSSRMLARDALAEGDLPVSDFAPLVNPRAHPFGEHPRILIAALEERYRSFLGALAERVLPTDLDRLMLCCHLLLQDRVVEARAQFVRARRDHLATGIQYDYARAWLALAAGDAAGAAAVAATYREHPVERWRWRFAELAAQAAEAGGKVVERDPLAGLAVRQENQSAAAPGLDLAQADETHLRIVHQRLTGCVLRFHPIDLELSYSRAPFAAVGSGAPSSPVAPAAELDVPLSGDATTVVEIPAAWRGRAVQVEAVAPGCRAQLLLMASRCALRLASASGELTVVDSASGKPLPAVYVKVYALHAGKPQFHKDGYTDLRGRFDYATLTAAHALDGVTRFAILVTSSEAGSVVREVEPPQR